MQPPIKTYKILFSLYFKEISKVLCHCANLRFSSLWFVCTSDFLKHFPFVADYLVRGMERLENEFHDREKGWEGRWRDHNAPNFLTVLSLLQCI